MRRRNIQAALILLLVIPSCRRGTPPVDFATAAPVQAAQIPPTVSAQRRSPVVVAVHNMLPSVVNIQTEATMRRQEMDPWFGFFGEGREYRTQSLGSGFVWASDGIVVTNAHVIEGASRVVVNLQDGRQLDARVIGADPDNDLAVLSVNAKNLPAAPIGTSADLLIGETVIAVGNPFGLSGSVTTGVISATGRSVPSKEQGRTFTDFIQTDASINPGNSGGPLLNIEGKVIGINVAIYAQAQGIGFAIPVDRAKKIIEDLRRYGAVHGVWIGAITRTLTPEEAQRLGLPTVQGALVTRVFSDSPAAAAGIRPGDVITQVNQAPIESRDAFGTATATASAGQPLSVRVSRDGEPVNLTVRPADPPADLGIRILQAISGLEFADRGNRVIVDDVATGSRGDRVGLDRGDVIVGINGVEISSVRQLNEEASKAADRSSIVLYVARGRFIYTLTFPMGV